jgi:hypothetical protein
VAARYKAYVWVAGVVGSNATRVLSCVGRGLCDGLITRSEESYRVSNCMCGQRNPERGPMFQAGNERKMNEWMNESHYRQKENSIGDNWTRVARTVGKHVTDWALRTTQQSLLQCCLSKHSEELKNKILFHWNCSMSTPNILARKSGKYILPYCRTEVESEGKNERRFLLSEASGDY